ncbi:uncharacterized protein YybS (DUF2232 family) [Oikeobacillus pervagus]|uniref:Uncharacterized protein YybS (DUF2232 family) n=1 Tax=Oikeobacillus pervagus TaxID=1325931 RepID=A0AAJ1T2B6_9BACI|nr:YybS family protein [Oikeobacillus pervagus]MDQ0215396.1 uncharacterized protein YybS (DUF2232 family) [Oikeobacillus pervagus]
MVAIFTVLLLVSIYIPVLWIISMLFLILPFFIYSAKYPQKYSTLMVLASSVISMIIGGVFSIGLALAYGTTGLVMGYFVQMKKGKFAIYMAGSLTFLVNTILQYVIAIAFFQINFIEDFTKMFKESYTQSINLMKQLGQPVPDNMMEQFNEMLNLIQILMPSLLVLASFLIVLLMMIVNFPIAKRLGIQVPNWAPFREWQVPKSVLWYYLILLLGNLIVAPEPGSTWYIASVNLMFMLQLCFYIQGLAFIYFYGHYKNWTKAIPIIITIVSILFLPILYFIRLLGIIDLGFHLRQRLQQKS